MLLKNTCRYCLQMLLQEAEIISARINEFLEDEDLLKATDEQKHVRLGFRLEANCYEIEEVARLEAGLICEMIEYEDDKTKIQVCKDEMNLTTKECSEDEYVLSSEELKPDAKESEIDVVVANSEDYMGNRNTESVFIILNEDDLNMEMEIGESQENENNYDVEAADHSDHSDNTVQSPARPFACIECDKCFRRYQDLKQHSLIHSGHKPFICDVCGRSFRQKNTLHTHQALHYGKTIGCSECDKKFARRSHLIKHIRLYHRGERPFRCTYLNCKAAYAARALLVAHQQMHVGVREYTCKLCGGAFFNRHGLLGHMYGVHSNYSYECEHCKKHFTKPYNIRKHMHNIHGVQIGSVAHLKKPLKTTQPPAIDDTTNADEELTET